MTHRFARLGLLLPALALAACAQQPAEDPAATAAATTPSPGEPATVPPAAVGEPQASASPASDLDDDPCGAAKVAPWIGKEATVPVRSEVARAAGAASDRWIYPDSVVTQDLRMDRLNVVMEKGTNRIVEARCG